jgi:hypothetical protein
MRPEQFDDWKNAALNELFRAIAASPRLREILIFKGARILNQRLNFERMSLDLDTNLSAEFSLEVSGLEDQAAFLREELTRAFEDHFRNRRIVRYTLESVRLTPKKHPLGWHAHSVKVKLRDAQLAGILGLPALDIDISAPEKLSGHALGELPVDGHYVRAYTMERIAGEKLRAFLSTLPAYRAKVKKPGEAVRVKDLYDLVRIYRVRPLRNTEFWDKAGVDFRLACESRFIDCQGLSTFQENWPATRQAFVTDPTLRQELPVHQVSFDDVTRMLAEVVGYFERTGLLPFAFPFPESIPST